MSALADKLGMVKAQQAELARQEAKLKEQLRRQGEGTYEGDLYRVAVFSRVTEVTDYRKIAERLKPSRQLLQAHTKQRESVVIKVSSCIGD